MGAYGPYKPHGKKRPRKWHHGQKEDEKFMAIDDQLPWPTEEMEDKSVQSGEVLQG